MKKSQMLEIRYKNLKRQSEQFTFQLIDQYDYMIIFMNDQADQGSEFFEFEGSSLVITPEMEFFKVWNVVVLILMLVLTFYMPMSIAFNYDLYTSGAFVAGYQAFDWTINCLFILDILISFNTAYVDAYDRIITSRFLIALNYLKIWFWIDVVSVIPFDQFNSNLVKIMKIPKLYKLAKIAKIMRLAKILKKYDNFLDMIGEIFGLDRNTVQLTFTSIIALAFTHIFTCFYVMLGIEFRDGRNEVRSDAWMAGKLDILGSAAPDDMHLYVLGFYWGIQSITTVGYGDMVPSTFTEVYFTIMEMILSGVVWFILLGLTMNYLADNLKGDEAYESKADMVSRLQVNLGLSEHYTKTLLKILNKNSHNKKEEMMSIVVSLDQFDVKNKEKLLTLLFQDVLYLIAHYNPELMADIFDVSTVRRYMYKDVIYSERDKVQFISLLMIGKYQYSFIQETCEDFDYITLEVPSGSIIGDEFIYFSEAVGNMVALEESESYQIAREDLLKIMWKFPLHFIKRLPVSILKYEIINYYIYFIKLLIRNMYKHGAYFQVSNFFSGSENELKKIHKLRNLDFKLLAAILAQLEEKLPWMYSHDWDMAKLVELYSLVMSPFNKDKYYYSILKLTSNYTAQFTFYKYILAKMEENQLGDYEEFYILKSEIKKGFKDSIKKSRKILKERDNKINAISNDKRDNSINKKIKTKTSKFASKSYDNKSGSRYEYDQKQEKEKEKELGSKYIYDKNYSDERNISKKEFYDLEYDMEMDMDMDQCQHELKSSSVKQYIEEMDQ